MVKYRVPGPDQRHFCLSLGFGMIVHRWGFHNLEAFIILFFWDFYGGIIRLIKSLAAICSLTGCLINITKDTFVALNT